MRRKFSDWLNFCEEPVSMDNSARFQGNHLVLGLAQKNGFRKFVQSIILIANFTDVLERILQIRRHDTGTPPGPVALAQQQ